MVWLPIIHRPHQPRYRLGHEAETDDLKHAYNQTAGALLQDRVPATE